MFYFAFQNIMEHQRIANWNTPRMRSMLINLLGYSCPVLYNKENLNGNHKFLEI